MTACRQSTLFIVVVLLFVQSVCSPSTALYCITVSSDVKCSVLQPINSVLQPMQNTAVQRCAIGDTLLWIPVQNFTVGEWWGKSLKCQWKQTNKFKQQSLTLQIADCSVNGSKAAKDPISSSFLCSRSQQWRVSGHAFDQTIFFNLQIFVNIRSNWCKQMQIFSNMNPNLCKYY